MQSQQEYNQEDNNLQLNKQSQDNYPYLPGTNPNRIQYHQQKQINKKYHKINPCSLYSSRRGRQGAHNSLNYASNIKLIATFYTLQQFFLIYKSLRTPSQCPTDIKILLFKQHCKPYWQQWLQSGCLLIQLKKIFSSLIYQKLQQSSILDHIWQFILFHLIGNLFHQDIIGVCLNKRQKITVLQLWLKKQDNIRIISQQIQNIITKEVLSIAQGLNSQINSNSGVISIKYKRHRDSINTHSTLKGAHHIQKGKKQVSINKQDWYEENIGLNQTF